MLVLAGVKVATTFKDGALISSFKIPDAYTGRWETFHFQEVIPLTHSNMDPSCEHQASYYHNNPYSRTLANTQASIKIEDG